jgi:hypothetical protein
MSVKLTPGFNRAPVRFDRPNLMLVEGPDDQAFADKIIQQWSQPDQWHVHFMDGNKTDWNSTLEVVLDDAWFHEGGRSVSLVRDADLDPVAVFASLTHTLRARSLPVPAEAGEVVAGGRWTTGVFVMPGGLKQGALEELLLESIDSSPRVAMARDYIERVTASFGAPPHPSKSTLQSYFAGHESFVKWISLGLQMSSILSSSANAFQPFGQFVATLATESTRTELT